MSASTYTYVAWGSIIAIGGGAYYILSRNEKPGRAAAGKQSGRRDSKAAAHKLDDGHSSDQAKAAKKKKAKAPPKPQTEAKSTAVEATSTAVPSTSSRDRDEDEELSNREFARQFQSAQAGTIANSQPATAARQKSVKQSQAKTAPVAAKEKSAPVPAASSSIDVAEPESKAEPIVSNDVSDMIEKSAVGPAVMRITEPVNSQPKKEKKAAKPVEAPETKKQRQNRLKKEAEKEARQEAETERRVLMEKQRRTAREAEGRAAQDGSTFMATKAPASSVWTAPAAAQDTNNASSFEPLDTFESSKPAPASAAKTNGTWTAPLPTEEEQIRQIQEEDAWESVTTKKGKKKTNEPAAPSIGAQDRKEPAAAARAEKATPIAAKPNIPTRASYNVLADEGSAAPNGAGAQDFVEEDEWEVA